VKIIILTSLFFPEIAANAKRMTHLAEDLKDRGHDVFVITAFPYYSTSKDLEKYKGKWIVKDQYEGIPIIRTYAYSSKKYGNISKRLWSFLSFTFSSIFGAVTVRGKADVVLTISPPFLSFFSGYLISLIKKASFVLDIQDIYPETLVALGFLKNKIVIKSLELLERFFYKSSKGIVAISEGFKQDFVNKGANPHNIAVLHNWVDINNFQLGDGKALRKTYGFDGKFVVMFVGTMGFAQGLENLVKAAELLKEHKNGIQFVLLGDGVEREKLENLVKSCGLSNFTFIPPKPNSEIPRFLSIADACLVSLRKNKLYEITIPCKTYEYMSMGKSVIMGVRGEAQRLIEQGGCGIGIEPESPDDLAKAILNMYTNKNLTVEMGRRGREFAASNFSRKTVTDQYIDFLERCGNKSL